MKLVEFGRASLETRDNTGTAIFDPETRLPLDKAVSVD
jgi:hypothetical protein